MSNPKFRIGMIFSTSRILKEALEHHKVIMGTHIKLRKSDLTRLEVIAKEIGVSSTYLQEILKARENGK